MVETGGCVGSHQLRPRHSPTTTFHNRCSIWPVRLQGFPRHLGIHSGGMVICDRPVVEVCPVEWARMENRSVLQWDKDDSAAVGCGEVRHARPRDVRPRCTTASISSPTRTGIDIDLATIPQEDCVYDMICAADTIGVFQIESRAQMATLPRLGPRCFYDLVVEVALIRPGPIQGGSVHPYIRRRNGVDPVTYLHPLLEKSLGKTLGIPLFQEQLMQMAIDVAGFTAGDADQLRQAMGSKRSRERMDRLHVRFYEGMAVNGIVGETADAIWEKLAAFANFGFPESHSVSFAYLVYSRCLVEAPLSGGVLRGVAERPAHGVLGSADAVADARRHGVTTLGPDVDEAASGRNA